MRSGFTITWTTSSRTKVRLKTLFVSAATMNYFPSVFVLVLGCLLPVSLAADDAVANEKPVTINRPVSRSSPEPQQWVRYSADYLRCFCNLPQCIQTGYMCKSSGGGCFSDLPEHSYDEPVPKGRHGCIEHLSNREQRAWCKSNPTSSYATIYPRRKSYPRTLLVCCYHDMCNHADNPEATNIINNTLLEQLSIEDEKHVETIINQETNRYANPDVWFKAATIAVPIIGAVILFALIALAVKILRTESRYSSSQKLSSLHYLHSPRPHQTAAEKFYNCNRNYDNVICQKQNPLFFGANSHHKDELQRHTLDPLLVQSNEANELYLSKDVAIHRVNLYECDEEEEESKYSQSRYYGANRNQSEDFKTDAALP